LGTVFELNMFHGGLLVFTNRLHVTVCTLTPGFYKNRGASFTNTVFPNFDATGMTGVEILETPVKGNPYFIIAHQYIAAYLNLQRLIAAGGSIADLPLSVQLAITAAQSYFAVASPGNPTPGIFTQAHITEIADVLAAFNEGEFPGFGHCDD
jgi:hypothetical protein